MICYFARRHCQDPNIIREEARKIQEETKDAFYGLHARRPGGGGEIPSETVIHILGECPALAAPRARFLDYRKRRLRRSDTEPTPKRIAIWVLRQDPANGEPAGVGRAAAEFAADAIERRRQAMRELNIWKA